MIAYAEYTQLTPPHPPGGAPPRFRIGSPQKYFFPIFGSLLTIRFFCLISAYFLHISVNYVNLRPIIVYLYSFISTFAFTKGHKARIKVWPLFVNGSLQGLCLGRSASFT